MCKVRLKQKIFDPVGDFRKIQREGLTRWGSMSFPDVWLIFSWLALLAVGFVMVASTSMTEAISHGQSAYYYIVRQMIFLLLSVFLVYIFVSTPIKQVQDNSARALVATLTLLLMLYLPGIGVQVNGAKRWLNLGPFNLQVGEMAKLVMIIFAADFLNRHNQSLGNSWKPMVKLLVITAMLSVILIKQPDFGTTVVIVATVFGMMFMAEVGLRYLLTMSALALALLVMVLLSADYRRQRLFGFLDPWANHLDAGYQLTNSLIAIGNGGWFGRGLGESVQKHQFLPEAHTDFIFSIITEELGLLGAFVVMMLYALLVWRAFAIGLLADKVRMRFSSYYAYGVGLWIAIQVLINVAVTSGAMPTKGLTLPLISYGGSSMIMTCVALAILLRVDAQARFQAKREGRI